MAGNHILLSYKIFDAISNSGLSERDSWQLILNLVEYDRNKKTPKFPNGVLKALWTVIKPELDSYAKNWKSEVKRRAKAGEKGGSSTSERKVVAARENGRKGGAPVGNKNAVKTTQADNENGNVNKNGFDLDLL